jgi:hypothetical protein
MNETVPRELGMIIYFLSEYIETGGQAAWLEKEGESGIYWTDEGYWQPLVDIGYNRTYGFYSISHLPNVVNEA